MSPFLPIAFQSSLSTEAILFGVFGFLYSVYAMYSNPTSKSELERPPIVAQLRYFCKVVAILIAINALFTVASLLLMYYSGGLNGIGDILLSTGFVLTMIVIAIISGVWVFKHME